MPNKMVERIFRKLRLLTLQSVVRSYDEFKTVSPFEQLDTLTLDKNKEKLRLYYEHYVKEISSPEMAASLELASFIYTTCKINAYTKLLDLGSGLSSFVFRLYASETPGVVVYSVDDNSGWLLKTKEFLKSANLNTDNLLTLNELLATKESEFDFILHDLNFVEVRINYIEEIMARVKINGLIILDDVHKPDYRFQVLLKLSRTTSKVFSIEPVTRDSYGRYSFVVLRG